MFLQHNTPSMYMEPVPVFVWLISVLSLSHLLQLDALPEEKQQEIQRALHLFSLGGRLPKTLEEASKHSYRFWDTQPVPKLSMEQT